MIAKSISTIVIINDNARITGGADKVALASARGLARRGYAVHLLCAVAPDEKSLPDTAGLHVTCTDQFEILHDPNRLRAAAQGLWNVKSQSAAEQLFGTLDVETTIVHVHLWAKALSSSVIRVAVERGFQIVCTLHDYLLACPIGTFFDHTLQTICTRKPMSLDCITAHCDSRNYGDKLWRIARQAIQSTAGRHPRGLTDIIAISDLVLSVMQPFLPSSARMHRLSNFVEVEQQNAVEVGSAGSNDSFVFVGRLVPEKGAALFAAAAREEQVPALFLGEGGGRAEIEQIYPQAEITGWLSSAETMQRLRGAKAVVFPSRWYEAQPLVVLEALALGIPCIVADTSAAREMIVDGDTGLLFKAGDVADLRRAIVRMGEPGVAAKLGRNAYEQYWAAPRTLDRHLDGLLAIYDEMLNGSVVTSANRVLTAPRGEAIA